MSEAVVGALVRQLDRAFERIRPKVEGLTDREYLWEPVPGCWTVHRRRPEDRFWEPGVEVFVNGGGEWVADYAGADLDPPPFTTIAWRMNHVASIAWVWTDHVLGNGGPQWDDHDVPHTADAAVAWWDEGCRGFRDAAAALRDEGLKRRYRAPWGDERAVEGWIEVFLDEQVHHMAEVGVLRDLYRETGGAPVGSARPNA